MAQISKMEYYYDIYVMLRKIRLLGLCLSKADYKEPGLEELGEFLIDAAVKGLSSLSNLIPNYNPEYFSLIVEIHSLLSGTPNE